MRTEQIRTACACSTASSDIEESELLELVTQLKALAHPVRLRMVDLIHEHGGDICVCEFERHFDLKQPKISHHLKILREAGLIRSRQEGSWVHHYVVPECFLRIRERIGHFAEKMVRV